ncbi:MAG: hypothetical protein H8E86_00495 [Planctomycetes bacterium]|nr:hypothetical protein [Planctomycetota bacterium]
MIPKFTTYLLLTAIAVQAVFGGLQDNVSICLGGGHEHEVAEVVEVVEQCEFECSHHSTFPTPVTEVDIENCDCTDLELALITLLSIPRNADDDSFLALQLHPIVSIKCSVENQPLRIWRGPPQLQTDTPAKRLQLIVVRTTRLLV